MSIHVFEQDENIFKTVSFYEVKKSKNGNSVSKVKNLGLILCGNQCCLTKKYILSKEQRVEKTHLGKVSLLSQREMYEKN